MCVENIYDVEETFIMRRIHLLHRENIYDE